MVLVNKSSPMDLVRMPSFEADPGHQDDELRMRMLEEAVNSMEENEKLFYTKQLENDGFKNSTTPCRLVPSGLSRTSRPCSLVHSGHNRTLRSNNVSFSQKNSAMSMSYSSPRQYTLSASTVKRSASGLMDRIRQRTVSSLRLKSLASTQSFDYDEYEGKQVLFL